MAPYNLVVNDAESSSSTTTSSEYNQITVKTVINEQQNKNQHSLKTQQHKKSFWDPNEEKAACGVGFIVNINAEASNRVSPIFYF